MLVSRPSINASRLTGRRLFSTTDTLLGGRQVRKVWTLRMLLVTSPIYAKPGKRVRYVHLLQSTTDGILASLMYPGVWPSDTYLTATMSLAVECTSILQPTTTSSKRKHRKSATSMISDAIWRCAGVKSGETNP